MKTFVMNIRGEILKARGTSAFWLSLISGMFVPALVCIGCIIKPAACIKIFMADPWWQYMLVCWQAAVPFLFPVYVILLCSLIAQIEYRNGTWKQVFASPRSYFDIYMTKYIVILLLILFSLMIFNLTYIAGGYILSLINHEFRFIDARPAIYSSREVDIKDFCLYTRHECYTVLAGYPLSQFYSFLWYRLCSYDYRFLSRRDGSRRITFLISILHRFFSPSDDGHRVWNNEETIRNSIFIFLIVMLLGFLDLRSRKIFP